MVKLALLMARCEVLDVGAHRRGCLRKGHPREIPQGNRHMRVMAELMRCERPGLKGADELRNLIVGAIDRWWGSVHRSGSFPVRRRSFLYCTILPEAMAHVHIVIQPINLFELSNSVER